VRESNRGSIAPLIFIVRGAGAKTASLRKAGSAEENIATRGNANGPLVLFWLVGVRSLQPFIFQIIYDHVSHLQIYKAKGKYNFIVKEFFLSI
jgi:hypothetical protein